MAQVFISYARNDAPQARGMAAALERAGHKVWWDRHIPGGTEYGHEIEDALRDADAVVVLWSQDAVNSSWVRDEAADGRDSRRLVPVTIDGTLPPLGFRQLQTIDLAGWNGRGNPPALRALLAAVARLERSDRGSRSGDVISAPQRSKARGRPRFSSGPLWPLAVALAVVLALLLPGRWNPLALLGFSPAAGPIVAAALASVIVIVLAEWLAPTDKLRRIVEGFATGALLAAALVMIVPRAAQEMIIDINMPAQRIAGGGSVRLVDITSLNGWNEGRIFPEGGGFRILHGDHTVNRTRPDAEKIFTTILRQLDIQAPVGELMRMSQQDWERFLAGVPDQKRPYVGGIPFAVLELRSSDGRTERTTVFKNEQVSVLNGRGDAEAYLCIRHVWDIRGRSSDESETIALAHSLDPCGEPVG
jgi:hypothetical protein